MKPDVSRFIDRNQQVVVPKVQDLDSSGTEECSTFILVDNTA
jgi:hypothetical protein